MKRVLEVTLLLYLVALHCSMAAMEIFAWAVFVLAVVIRLQEGRGFKFPREVLWPYLTYVILVLLSLLMNPEIKPFWMQFGFMRFGIVLMGLYWAIDLVWSKGFEKKFLSVWWICVSIVGVYAIFQCLTGVDFIRPNTGAISQQGGDVYKAPGFFSISLTFAYSFGLSLWLGALPALKEFRAKYMAPVILVGLLGFLASMSRGAWIAMVLTIALYLLIEQRKWALPFAGVVVAVATALTLFTHGFGDKISNMVHLRMDHSSATRVDLWRGYWAMFKENPWFGVGIFQGDKLLPDYYAKLGIDTQQLASHAHNNFLESLAGCGILGTLAFVWLIGVFFIKSWQMRNMTVWGWSTFLALLFVFIGGMTECNFIDAEVNHMIMLTWGLLLVFEARFKVLDLKKAILQA